MRGSTITRLMVIAALGLGLSAPGLAYELGHTGMHVELTPSSLLLMDIEPSSPADLANLPDPHQATVRLAYVNGAPVLDLLDRGELAGALASDSLMVTFGVRRDDSLEERLAGPYTLDLVDLPRNRLRRYLAARQYDRALGVLEDPALDEPRRTVGWMRVILEARELARSARWQEASSLAQLGGMEGAPYNELLPNLENWNDESLRLSAQDLMLSPREVVRTIPNPALAPHRPARHAHPAVRHPSKPKGRRIGHRRR